MSDDPPDPWEGIAGAHPEDDQLAKGLQLFEQLKNVESAGAAFRAVNDGGLSKADLQAIVIFQVFYFRQQADDPDTYGAWSAT